ncbi:MAG TPA: helix-hairpin-helix domain-containing protein [Bacillota bacterium]
MLQLSVRQRLAALILVVLLALGGVVLFLQDGRGESQDLPARIAAEPIYVHVCGAVVRPGVIQMKPGTRKLEAIRLAGGALPEADMNSVNLAEFAEDGEQIYLALQGETVPVNTPKKTSTASSVSRKSKLQPALKPSFPYDLNTVTLKELDIVPGIGPSLAQKILEYRTTHGRFQSYDELLNVSGVGTAKLDKFRSYLYVK